MSKNIRGLYFKFDSFILDDLYSTPHPHLTYDVEEVENMCLNV